MTKILNLKLVAMYEYLNIKTFLHKAIRNWSEDVPVIKKVKNTLQRLHVISDLNDEKMFGTFYKK